MEQNLFVLLSLLSLVAFLYASVGHGGASGYLVVMALLGVSPALMKSSALVMNLSVSLISFIGFYRAGHFRGQLFWPFAVASIPMAFWGGTITLSDSIYKQILAGCIVLSIVRLLYQFKSDESPPKPIPVWAGLLSGAIIGLLSGMIGIGGGILLSPLLLLLRWATLKQTAAVSALFIFVNSLSGLVGQLQKGGIHLPQNLQYAILATIFGGLLGSYLGSQRFNLPTLRYLLAVGMVIASIKLLLT